MITPDYRNFQYSNDLFHYGMPRRSGRYPWGSGDRPYQSRDEKKKIRKEQKENKNLSIGKERLENRLKKADEISDVDRLSRKIGWSNTEKAGKAHERVKNIKQISKEILEDEKRTKALGDYTRKVRIADVAITSSSVAAVTGLGGAALLGLWGLSPLALGIPVGAGVGVGKIGYEIYKATKY